MYTQWDFIQLQSKSNNEVCRKMGGIGGNTILNEVTQVQKDKHCFFALTTVVTAFMWA